MQNFIFSIRDQSVTNETKDYIRGKLTKLGNLTKGAESITINIVQIKTHVNDYKDLQVEILVKLPNAFVKVENKGHNINVLVDKLIPVLKKRLSRYHEIFETRREKQLGWKSKDLEKSIYIDDYIDNTNYEPYIKRKYLEENSPIHPAEAVEKMELLGHSSFLFKNIENGLYAMLYKREKGGYGLVQPKS